MTYYSDKDTRVELKKGFRHFDWVEIALSELRELQQIEMTSEQKKEYFSTLSFPVKIRFIKGSNWLINFVIASCVFLQFIIRFGGVILVS